MNKFTLLIPILLIFISCDQTGLSDENIELDPVDPVESNLNCEGEFAGNYPCKNINLKARLSPANLLGEKLNDIWGWTDPQTEKEYALVGLTDGVTFVDVTNPVEPIVIGKLPESIESEESNVVNLQHHQEKSAWRDMKVYKDHMFVVSDGQIHGLQVFDLTKLREYENKPIEFTDYTHYTEFGAAHNIAINEETGFAYIVGSDTFGGGLHIINIQNPEEPVFSAGYANTEVGIDSTGYVHDTQCVVYQGPDAQYRGHELCFNSSETHLEIVDVTDKESVKSISAKKYEGQAYAHQGWLTEDHRYFLLDDEFDEVRNKQNTRTYIWNVSDLDNPEVIDYYESSLGSRDHNQYVKENRVYQANYTTGLRVLNLDNISSGNLHEMAYFDTFPKNDSTDFDGAWSNYPFFESGIIVVSDISNGLFILEPHPE